MGSIDFAWSSYESFVVFEFYRLVVDSKSNEPEEQKRESLQAMATERKVAIITGGGKYELITRSSDKC